MPQGRATRPVTVLLAVGLALLWLVAAARARVRPLPADTPGFVQTEQRISINHADGDTLRVLPGIGQATAARIVEHRGRHGPFGAVDDLDDVHGIGAKTVRRLRPFVTLHGD